jgi:hypothetical protein
MGALGDHVGRRGGTPAGRAGAGRACLLAALAIALCLVPGPAAGRPAASKEARERAEGLRARALYFMAEKDYDRAAEQVRAAIAISPDPSFWLLLGKVAEASRRIEDASHAYRTCVTEGAEDELRRECESAYIRVQQLRVPGVLSVVSDDAQARVFVDGATVGHALGDRIRLVPGIHRIDVRGANGRSHSADVYLEPGGLTEVVSTGSGLSGAGVAKAGKGAAASSAIEREEAWFQAPADSYEPSVREEAGPATTTHKVLAWVGLGTGIALTGLGGAFIVQDALDRKNAQGERFDEKTGVKLYEADYVKVRNLAIGVPCAAVGIGLIVTSAILWPKSSAAVGMSPEKGGGSLWVALEF